LRVGVEAPVVTIDEIRATAFAMPLTSPAFPRGPYRFIDREFLTITYRTDPELLRAIVPEPLEVEEPLVRFEFIRMPNSSGFGDYTEAGQVIPVRFEGVAGTYVHNMFLNDQPAIAGGRELWGFPKKLASPRLNLEVDTVVGTLDYGPVRIATATMAFKYQEMDRAALALSFEAPNFLLKIIPHVDGSARICELVRYFTTSVAVRGAWVGPGTLELHPHALAPVSELPVQQVVSAHHYIADLTLDIGEVVHDYLLPKVITKGS
jgi:acetoacetate decarboxylase